MGPTKHESDDAWARAALQAFLVRALLGLGREFEALALRVGVRE